jgi:hypothetical protein
MEPIRMCEDRQSYSSENDQQDQAASTAAAGTTSAKTESPFEPFEQFVEQKEFKQTSKASLTITHGILLGFWTFKSNMKQKGGQISSDVLTSFSEVTYASKQ